MSFVCKIVNWRISNRLSCCLLHKQNRKKNVIDRTTYALQYFMTLSMFFLSCCLFHKKITCFCCFECLCLMHSDATTVEAIMSIFQQFDIVISRRLPFFSKYAAVCFFCAAASYDDLSLHQSNSNR